MVIGLSLASVMGFRPDAPHLQQQLAREQAFTEELSARLGDSSGGASADAAEPGRASERHDRGGTTGVRRQPPAAAASSSSHPVLPSKEPPPSNGPIRASASGSVFDLENPVPKVKELLVKMGINPEGIQFDLLDDVVSNPLGEGHVNHLMRVRMPTGWKLDFAVEYILRNPAITAHEISALNKLPEAPAHLRGV